MVMTDPIADMLARIRNAFAVGKLAAKIPYSKVRFALLETLRDAGFVGDVRKIGRMPRRMLEVDLKYENGAPVISGVRRVSKPGRRVYQGWRELKRVRQGLGALILSTPQGLMTDRAARKAKVGGEVLLEIW